MKKLIVYYCLFFTLIRAHNPIYIVIHGTWAAQQAWSKQGGDFFEELTRSVTICKGSVVSFCWSGKVDNQSRLAAGKELAAFLCTLPEETPLHIVAHSHGANVAILASKELLQSRSNHRIEKLFALGVPVNSCDYMPCMEIIHYFYNFFSLHDYVQPMLGMFGRTYPYHERIVNIRVVLEGKQGSHSQLHDPMIARWIPHIHEYLAERYIGNFHQFMFSKPATIYFFNDGEPFYKEDRTPRSSEGQTTLIAHGMEQATQPESATRVSS